MNRILMLLENAGYPEDSRVRLEAESLAAAGFRVAVISPTEGSKRVYERLRGVDVYRYPRPWEFGGLLGYVWEFGYSLVMQALMSLYVFAVRGFDAVHLHAPPDMNAVIPAFYRLFGVRHVYDMHDLSPELYAAQKSGKPNRLLHRLLLRFEKFAVARADRLIATNETQRRTQIERGGADPQRCSVVRNGPNKKFLDAMHAPSVGSSDRVTIGFVGMMGFQDGVDYLVRALGCLQNDHGRDDFDALIVGAGPAFKSLKALSAELGLDERVEFTGLVEPDEVPALIARFDIGATPDPSNPYNDSCTTIKAMEYMALGKPSVCFETHENATTAGPSALYAKNNDPADFAAQLARLIDDPGLRHEMGQAGRDRVLDGLTWRSQEKPLIDLYDGLLGAPKRPALAQPAPARPPLTPSTASRERTETPL